MLHPDLQWAENIILEGETEGSPRGRAQRRRTIIRGWNGSVSSTEQGC